MRWRAGNGVLACWFGRFRVQFRIVSFAVLGRDRVREGGRVNFSEAAPPGNFFRGGRWVS